MTQKSLTTRLRAIQLLSKQTTRTINLKKHLIPDFFFTVSSNSGLPHPDNPYYGISESSFSEEITKVLLTPVVESDVEIKPDGELCCVDVHALVLKAKHLSGSAFC